MSDVHDSEKSGTFKIPLFSSFIHAGFPFPADDYKETSLDFNELLIQNPQATYAIRVRGDSMKDACITDGDIIVVDRAVEAKHNSVIVARVNQEFIIKRLYHRGESIYLVPANRSYEPMRITEDTEFEVWGVVIHCVHKVR